MPDQPPTDPAAEPQNAFAADPERARGPILDDALKPTRLISVRDLKRAALDDRPALRQTAHRLRHAIRSELANTSGLSIVSAVVTGVVVVIGTPIIIMLLQMFSRGGLVRGMLALILVPTFLVIVCSRSFRYFVVRRVRRSLAFTAVAEGVCGSCAFSLEGAPVVYRPTPRCPQCGEPGQPGRNCRRCHHYVAQPRMVESPCVVCAECGAAWLASRLTRPHWEQPVYVSNRVLWYAWLLPGLRPYSNLLTQDDRGRYVHAPDPRLLRVPRETFAKLRTTRRELARLTRHAGWGFRVGAASPIFLLVAFFVLLILLESVKTYPDWSLAISLGVFGVLFLFATVVTLLSGLGRPPKSTARCLTKLGLCGSCLYPLGGLSPDASGLVDCPRCGASWRAAAQRQTETPMVVAGTTAGSGPPAEPTGDIPSPNAD